MGLIEKQKYSAANKLIFLLRVDACSSSDDPLAFAFRILFIELKSTGQMCAVNNLVPISLPLLLVWKQLRIIRAHFKNLEVTLHLCKCFCSCRAYGCVVSTLKWSCRKTEDPLRWPEKSLACNKWKNNLWPVSRCFGVHSVCTFGFSSSFPRRMSNEILEMTRYCIGFLSKVVPSLSGEWGWGRVGQCLLTLLVIWEKMFYSDPKHPSKGYLDSIFTESSSAIRGSLYCLFIYLCVRKCLLY